MFTWKHAVAALGVAVVLGMSSVPAASLLISRGKCVFITKINSETCFGYMTK